MYLLIMGPPGAGKGTQAAKLVNHYNIMHFSTGDIFRKHIEDQTKIGIEAKRHIDQGMLVPDDVTNKVIRELFLDGSVKRGFLLDGYPRTLGQTESFDELLEEFDIKLDAVLNIVVSDELLLKRIIGRRVCSNCGKSFHVHFNPPAVENVCDICGSKLYQRDDDNIDVVSNRINVYKKKTKPILDFYEKKGLVISVDGEKSLENVFQSITRTLGDL